MCSIELHPQSLTLFLKRRILVLSKRGQFLFVFVVFMRQGNFVAHLGLELVSTSDPPALTSQEAGENKLFI